MCYDKVRNSFRGNLQRHSPRLFGTSSLWESCSSMNVFEQRQFRKVWMRYGNVSRRLDDALWITHMHEADTPRKAAPMVLSKVTFIAGSRLEQRGEKKKREPRWWPTRGTKAIATGSKEVPWDKSIFRPRVVVFGTIPHKASRNLGPDFWFAKMEKGRNNSAEAVNKDF